MPHWYEVFDNDEILWVTRRQATRLTALSVAGAVLTICLVGLALDGYLSLPLVGVLSIVVLYTTVRWSSHRLRKLRRIVWCVKLSQDRVVGYDYARRKLSLEWEQVERIDLSGEGLLIVGPPSCALEVAHLFPDFATLSHRLVHYADLKGVPVFIEGQPWQSLNVYDLFPFLADDPSAA